MNIDMDTYMDMDMDVDLEMYLLAFMKLICTVASNFAEFAVTFSYEKLKVLQKRKSF